MEHKTKRLKCEIYRDSMQNYKKYAIPPAQLIIADVPYNIGNNFYGSNPMWYVGGDNKNGESKFAKKAAFNSDFNFNLYEYFHFCSRLMKKDDKKPSGRGRSTDSPCMIVFCSFEQQHTLIDAAKKQGFANCIPLVFIKHYSPQVLKANMRVVGATEYALLFYRDRLPKFRNGLKVDENGKNIRGTGHMVFNWFEWERDGKEIPKIHPAQKPVKLLKKLIETFYGICGSVAHQDHEGLLSLMPTVNELLTRYRALILPDVLVDEWTDERFRQIYQRTITNELRLRLRQTSH